MLARNKHSLAVHETYSFGWLIIAKILLLQTQPTFLPWCFGLCQRPSSEEVCSIPFPVLATIVMWRGKKSVVRVAQRVAPLVLVQWLPSFFPNMYCLFDPSSTVWQYSFVTKFVNLYAFHICSCRWIRLCRLLSQVHVVMSHQFLAQQYFTTTLCYSCQTVIWGIGSQGYQCSSE